ncbi:MAG: TonB-dependent receptor [candidate division WOR-3 bacterium]|nr:TonB-dependent receptor [candidate division WOR-3 bacterium]
MEVIKMKQLTKLLIFILGLWGVAYAQYGKITGKVVDAKSGQPIVAAAVYLEEIGIGTYTDENGEFVLLRVPPGTYTLKVEFTGYSPFTLKNLVVETDRTVSPPGGIIKLQETGVVLQEQVVIAREPVVKKDITASVDKIRSEKLQSLPVANVEQALQLQAGVRRYGGSLQIRGGRVGEVAYVVDGADLRDPYNNARTPNLPLSSISEVSVNKGGFGAEFGNAASGVVEVVTKEGTDKYEFQLRARTSNYSALNNIYLGSYAFGRGLANFLSSSEGDIYAKYLSKRYLGSLYDEIYAYEILRHKVYNKMNFKSEDPLFEYLKPYYTDGMPFGENYYNMKPNLNRFEFSASGPIVKKYLRFSGSIDIQSGNGRFHRLNKGESPTMSTKYNQFNYQLKLTGFITQRFKLFGTTVGTNSLNSYWHPEWRLAPSHFTSGIKFDYKGYILGFNYLWSPKTYFELRAGRYYTNITSNIFEDINVNGIDDFADRDSDGYIEIDTSALLYKLSVGSETYTYGGRCIDLINEIKVNPNFSESTGIPNVLEVKSFWWNSLILGCYPQDRRNITLVTGITQTGDTITTTLEDPRVNQQGFKRLFLLSNLKLPTPSGYDRSSFWWVRNYTDQIRFDYVAQDFFNLKNHEVKAGFEYRNIRLKQDDWDFASGTNLYPDIVDANPKSYAFYVRDKIEFEGLIANVGLRFDYFDPNAYIPADFDVPIKEEYYSIINTITPDALDGAFTWDRGYGIRRDTLIMYNPVKVKPTYYISPRIGISHPISENDVLHFTYGHYFQVPQLVRLYMNQWWIAQGAYPIMGNPSLKPEKTISYELGIRHAFNPYSFIDITGYYKDIYDLIQTKSYYIHFIRNGVKERQAKWYTVYVNEDYASVRGLEIQLSKQLGGFLPFLFFDLNYTFQVARGSNSSPNANYLNNYYGIAPGYTQEYYLDWDQRHGVVLNIGLNVPLSNNNVWLSGFGGSLIYTYGTAQPYSPQLRSPRDVLELTNSLRFYGQNNVDLNLFKLYNVLGADIRFFANIYNLLNDKELITYSDLDYWSAFGPNSTYCQNNQPECQGLSAAEGQTRDISVYNAPRNVEIGIEINWRR